MADSCVGDWDACGGRRTLRRGSSTFGGCFRASLPLALVGIDALAAAAAASTFPECILTSRYMFNHKFLTVTSQL